jgi:hypothetical protein
MSCCGNSVVRTGSARSCAGSVSQPTCYFDPLSQSVKRGVYEVTRDPVTCAVLFDGVKDEAGVAVLPRPTQISCNCAQCPQVNSTTGSRAQVFSHVLCLDNGDQITAIYQWDGTVLTTVGWRLVASTGPITLGALPPDAHACIGGTVVTGDTFHVRSAITFGQSSVDVAPKTLQPANHFLEVNGVLYHDTEVTFSVAGSVLSWVWAGPFPLDAADDVFVHAYVSN